MAKTPKIGVALVDVRDVAKAHILAMTAAGAVGERIIERIIVAYRPTG
jgi:nucleoside-diphosphate-sugar epimerase